MSKREQIKVQSRGVGGNDPLIKFCEKKPEKEQSSINGKTSLPKLRTTSSEKCHEVRKSTSPRLKSFPAEKIKKIINIPIQMTSISDTSMNHNNQFQENESNKGNVTKDSSELKPNLKTEIVKCQGLESESSLEPQLVTVNQNLDLKQHRPYVSGSIASPRQMKFGTRNSDSMINQSQYYHNVNLGNKKAAVPCLYKNNSRNQQQPNYTRSCQNMQTPFKSPIHSHQYHYRPLQEAMQNHINNKINQSNSNRNTDHSISSRNPSLENQSKNLNSMLNSKPTSNHYQQKDRKFINSNLKPSRRNQSTNKKVYEFTPDMIRDQELLVQTLHQQGFGDDVISRQFNILLNEQTEQLEYMNRYNCQRSNESSNVDNVKRMEIFVDEKPDWMAHITPSRISCNELEEMNLKEHDEFIRTKQSHNDNNNHHQCNIMNDHYKYGTACSCYDCNNNRFHNNGSCHYFPARQYSNEYQQQEKHVQDEKKTMSSSLLKLRVEKQVLQPQIRNNGLQDPEYVKQSMESLRNSEDSRGLEYLSNLNKKRTDVKQDGTQDPKDAISHYPRSSEQVQNKTLSPKMSAANGLENNRNLNNPLPKSHDKMINECTPEFPERQSKRWANAAPEGHQFQENFYHKNSHGNYNYNDRQILECNCDNCKVNFNQVETKEQNLQDNCQQNNEIVQKPKIIGGISYYT